MDPTEDLSARVLLKNILSTEPPRTPITRSASTAASTSATRRSSRGGNKDAVAQTPQDMLRRSMRHKIRESITRKSLPATKRRTTSVVLKKVNTPGQPSMLFDDGDTPRHILKNILLTEPVRSPVVHERAETVEPQPSSANSGNTSKRPSIELSGLDLPDITIGNAASIVKGLSRKRPRRSLNVTAFEKRLKGGEDVEEEIEEALDEQSSLSLSSSTSLSLKTPFVDVRTERKHLQRRVSNRRKITEEEFGAAVDKRQMGEVSTFVERGHNETTFSEGFTLGFSKLSEPNITTDILHCNTALYAQPDAMTSSFSVVATQDKPTVMASQIQRQMMEEEELMEAAQNMPGEMGSLYLFPTEVEVVEELQIEESSSQSLSKDDSGAAEFPKEEWKSAAHGQHEDAAAVLQTEREEEGTGEKGDTAESEQDENRVEAQTEEDGSADSQAEEDEEEEGGVDSQPEEEVAARSQSEEEEVVPDSQTEEVEEGEVDSQTEELGAVEEEGDVVECQSGQEDPTEGGSADSQTEDEEEEEGGVESQPEEDVATGSQSEEEEVVPDSQTEEEEQGAVDSQTEELGAVEEEGDVVEYQSGQEGPTEGGLADSQAEDELDGMAEEEDDEQASEQLEPDFEHISRRSHYSAGGVMLVREAEGLSDATEAGWSDGKSKAHSAVDVHSSLEMGTHESGPHHTEIPDVTESSSQGQMDASGAEAEQDADKENSLHLSVEHSGHLNDDSPEEAAQDSAEQEDEWEEGDDDEENEEVPSKTPAFVRQKRRFFHPDPQASPVLKDVQASSSTGEGLSATKPKKQVRKTREPSKKKEGLPKSYLMSVFKHFAKTKVSADVYPVLQETMDKFFERVADDLETYALHAKRKTIEVEDVELLLKRQGYITDKVPVEVLIEKYLRMDQRKLLIPIATSGNVVIPKKRR